jgi:hypothetical protein
MKSRFKTDGKAAVEGVWIEYEPNTDGTTPRFCIARISKQNKKYQAAFRAATAPYLDEKGMVDFERMPDDVAEKLLLDVFVGTVLISWSNFQPEDDGVELKFTREAALEILGSDDWVDLYDELNNAAHKTSNFRQKAVKAQAKN